MRLRIRATHEGELMAVEATGRDIEFQNDVFSRLAAGKIAERWVQPDIFDILVQLGVIDDPRA